MRLTLAYHIFNKEAWIDSVVRSWLDRLSGAHGVEIIAVFDDLNDGSDRVLEATMADYPHITYTALYETAGWEIGCNNRALAEAQGEAIAFIQDDNWMYTPDWDAALVRVFEDYPTTGLVGLLAGAWMGPDGIITRVECDRPHKGEHFTAAERSPLGLWRVDFPTRPCAALVERVREFGGFDRAYYPMDFDETDLGMRMHRAGFMNIYAPFDLLNVVGKRDTIKEAQMQENWLRGFGIFMLRHGDYLAVRTDGTSRILVPVRDNKGRLEWYS